MGLLRLGQEPLQINPEASVADAVAVMVKRQLGAISVTAGGKILGMFTERDLMRRVVDARRDLDKTKVRDVMTSPVKTVSDSTSVADAASLMRRHHIRHLPIVDPEGNLLGMVALRYILYDLMDDLERKVDSLESYIMADSLGG